MNRPRRPAPKPSSATRRAPPWEVTPADLQCLDAVRSLLTALNNAYVSTRQTHTLILDIPVLAARCVRRIGSKQAVTPELLGLLEDLTTCRADLEEQQAARPSQAPGG